jgi:transposase-like protein
MASEREHLWRRRLDEQRTSGLTVRAFCVRHQLCEPSFYYWRRTVAERDRAAAESVEPAFVPVAVTPPRPPVAALEVHLPGGVRVSVAAGCEAGLLAMVLAAVAARPC